MSGTLEEFRRVGRSHLEGAVHVLEKTLSGSPTHQAFLPTSAAYLANVALECGLKAILLSRGGYASAEDLAKKQPKVYQTLFRGKSGHSLGDLAAFIRFQNMVEANGKKWKEDQCWERMTSVERPYSLRYGTERIKREHAEAEIERAGELFEMLTTIRKVPLKSRRGS
jgi:HEPN domain-containing protein